MTILAFFVRSREDPNSTVRLRGLDIRPCDWQENNNEKLEGIKICVELIEKYKLISGVSGIHLMGYKQEEDIASVISNFK